MSPVARVNLLLGAVVVQSEQVIVMTAPEFVVTRESSQRWGLQLNLICSSLKSPITPTR